MKSFSFKYQEYDSDLVLGQPERKLIELARNSALNAYAPYSHFKVACAVLLANHEVCIGLNIENAAYPIGICAERVALASALSQFPDMPIITLAISYLSTKSNNQPIFPCGMCRQFLLEMELKNDQNIPIFLSAQEGKVIKINKAADLLPFGFDGSAL